MTTITTVTDWNALVTAHLDARAAEQASNHPDVDLTDAEHDVIDETEWKLRNAVINAPALAASHMLYKVGLLIQHQATFKEDRLDNLDDLSFLQRLLDDDDMEGGFPLVRLYQDCHRLANVDHPVLSLTRSADKPWPELVAIFKSAYAHINRPDSEEVTDREAANYNPIRDAVFFYPVATMAELAEKVGLIKMDDSGDERGFKAIVADIMRLNE